MTTPWVCGKSIFDCLSVENLISVSRILTLINHVYMHVRTIFPQVVKHLVSNKIHQFARFQNSARALPESIITVACSDKVNLVTPLSAAGSI